MLGYVNRARNPRDELRACGLVRASHAPDFVGIIGLIIYLLVREPLPIPARGAITRRPALQIFVRIANATCILPARLQKRNLETDRFCPYARRS